eukprot:gene12234-13495_t
MEVLVERGKLKADISTIIKEIHTEYTVNDVSEWRFNFNKLFNEVRKQYGPFKNLGYGKSLKSFLEREFKIEVRESGYFSVDRSSLLDGEDETEQQTNSDERGGPPASSKVAAKQSRPNDTERQPCQENQQNVNDETENVKSAGPDSRPQASTTPSQQISSKVPFPVPKTPKKRFIMLVIMMYDCGLEGLRNLFQRINPNWSNSPCDVTNFQKDNLQVLPYERPRFDSGNINNWDISLLSKVLLYSSSKNSLGEKELKAIESLKKVKDEMVSHCANIELSVQKFEEKMENIRSSLMEIGVLEHKLTKLFKDLDVSEDNLYYKVYQDELDEIRTRVEILERDVAWLKKIGNGKIPQHEIPKQAQQHDPADWDEWVKLKKELNNFDDESNHYLLIVDKVSPSDAKYLTALGNIPWKLVLDLDPDSDIDGLLKHISPHHENSGVIVPYTPSELRDLKSIDLKRVHWAFVNGRNKDAEEDAPKSNYMDWRKCFRTVIADIINNFCQKLEKSKPVFCVILEVQESSLQIAKNVAQEVEERFSGKFSFKSIFLTRKFDFGEFFNPFYSNLSTKFLFIGIHEILGSPNKIYKLPSCQEGAPVPLENKKFHFLSENLEILYNGCQNIPTKLPDKDKEQFKKDHLKSFLKGNLISFESLHYRHDCPRSKTKNIEKLIRKICLPRDSTTQIVQIVHSPGTGGSTIGRRVLWDLHEENPCAIVKMPQVSDNFGSECDGEQFIASLSERVREIWENCELKPIVLIDGNTRQVRNISDQLVRRLNADGGKAVVLRIVNPQGKEQEYDGYFHNNSNFEVDSVLNDDEEDLENFRKAYNLYIKTFGGGKEGCGGAMNKLTRVFHFPMMAMLGEFKRLRSIVEDSLDILRECNPVEYEVAILVAFLQIYANRETPQVVIEKYLNNGHSVIGKTELQFSENLLCLMVSKKARSQQRWIGHRYDNYDADISSYQQMGKFTFQHLKVAEIVIEHSHRKLDDIAEQFVNCLVSDYKELQFRDLVNDLFLYQKKGRGKIPEAHFSHLVMKLEKDGRIFEEAAKKSMDANFYSHVARYYAMASEPLNFVKARALIKEGLEVDKFAKRENKRRVWDAEGHIMFREMKAKKVHDVEVLKDCAKEAISSFKKARDNPPMTYPNPLSGEVSVLLLCFDWIIKWKKGDVEAAFNYMADDDFFCSAPGDCFYLLDNIDEIIQSVTTLSDPAHTTRLANDSRLSLIRLFGTEKGMTKRSASVQLVNVPQICKEITQAHFQRAGEKEFTRLKAYWIINDAGRQFHLIEESERRKLLELLEKLVNKYDAYEYANDLLTVSTVQESHNSYSLEKALKIVKKWQTKRVYDASAFFNDYVIRFLAVFNGSVLENHAPFQDALEKCIKLCEGSHRKHQRRYYLAKDRDTEKMCCLISQAQLDQLCERDNKQKPKQGDCYQVEKKHLHECHGRVKSNPIGKKDYPFIALEQGNLKIGVDKYSLGKPYQDYTPGSKVTFFVYFTLAGPKAKCIRFNEKSTDISKLSRQMSK